MSTPAKDKLENDIFDAIVEAIQFKVSEEEILALINTLYRDVEDYGLEATVEYNKSHR